ncbi:helix-turn-helix domain-containing protein [Rhodocyclus tenuis]|uniref:Helix-turn-helix domain-containing protein n=1 Tax=Rhodocyclus gracilis TaxID=2929842 RepID=A0ABX0WJR0_9RHOO|nr:helix-turn-helix domain-containing protein [Rhodocyclus gracilis]MRD73773.1 helix-turn-helix domain-containing protein [Rhodocyclus gracilis]NJA89951.1 helix-turn-helix domain-containing protein [Rhodocyclus gracilis]
MSARPTPPSSHALSSSTITPAAEGLSTAATPAAPVAAGSKGRADAAPAINRFLAGQLRQGRLERGWSLDRTALETGVSKAMLGQIERGESSPTVATLWKIAAGFRCSLSAFLEPPAVASAGSDAHGSARRGGNDEAAWGQTLYRNVDALRSKPASDDMLVAALFPFTPELGFEWLELTLLAGYVRHSEAHAPGVTEHVIVLKGSMEVLVDEVWQALAEGDAVRFRGDRPHGYRNLGNTPAVCHNLIHYAAGEAAAA